MEAAADTPVIALRRALLDVLDGQPEQDCPVCVNGRALPEYGSVASCGVRDGAVLSVGRPNVAAVEKARPGEPQVRVVAGPDAGRVVPLDEAPLIVGRAARCDVVLDHPEVSRRHAAIRRQGNEVMIEDLESTNGTWVEGRRIKQPTRLLPQALVAVGESLLTWVNAPRPDAAVASAEGGTLEYNRPPRILPACRRRKVTFPAPPVRRDRPRFPVTAVLMPLVAGIGMALILRRSTYLMFTILSPATAITAFISQRRQGTRASGAERRRYQAAREQAETELTEALDEERHARRHASPDPAEIAATATAPTSRLWERRASDPDALVLRVGTGDLPPETEVTLSPGDDASAPARLWSVPVTLSLRDLGVLGIAALDQRARAVARWLVVQACVLHSPRELALVVLAPLEEQGWGFVRWLPHARPRDGQPCLALVGNDDETTAERIRELDTVIERRRTDRAQSPGNAGAGAFEDILVVLDGARRLRRSAGVTRLLKEGPEVGVYAICLDAEEPLLPAECQAVISLDSDDATRADVSLRSAEPQRDVLVDQVSCEWAEGVARALAPLRDASPQSRGAQLPCNVRLLDLLELSPPTPQAIAARWAQTDPTTAVVIGATAEQAFTVDLASDGPHGLVAGTTNAGKSELLQTLIASLATSNRPESMTFALIDYKGGSAFSDLAALPHAWLVTDLDGHLTERALVSLSAELRRRETLFAEVGAARLDQYWQRAPRHAEPLPRLVIVIDEFAAMVQEVPHVVSGLVGVARKGRSLGVHMILATQRPGGSVTPEIRANTNLRIALRTTDPSESTDIVGVPDAARITVPGRALMRTSHGQVTQFQSARVGGAAAPSAAQPEVRLTPLPWAALGEPLNDAPAERTADGSRTDVAYLVDAIRHAADTLGVREPRRPWLPPLPEGLIVADLETKLADNGRLATIPVGLEDLPDSQSQITFAVDLEHGGHLVLAGSTRCGRSSMLRTLAGSLALRVSARDAHLYVLDCGNRALAGLAELPHCGAFVTRDQVDRVDRLIGRLLNEVQRRHDLLAKSGCADVAEQRAAAPRGQRLPYMVLLIDRWEALAAAFDQLDGARIVDQVLKVLREGSSAGLRAVITGDRSTVTGRLGALIEERITLRQNESSDYAFFGLNARNVPKELPAGRGFRASTATEIQFALLTRDPTGPAQNHALRQIAKQASTRDKPLPTFLRPLQVAPLPARITLSQLRHLPSAHLDDGPLTATVGVGGDRLEQVGIDLDTNGPGFLIAGARKSGRSTALTAIVHSLLQRDCAILALLPRTSPVAQLAESTAAVTALCGDAIQPPRIHEHYTPQTRPLVIVIDDQELLTPESAATVIAALRAASRTPLGVVAAGAATEMGGFSGLPAELRKSRSGLLLRPNTSNDGEPLGIRLPPSLIAPNPIGRAALLVAGNATLVQIPAADHDSANTPPPHYAETRKGNQHIAAS